MPRYANLSLIAPQHGHSTLRLISSHLAALHLVTPRLASFLHSIPTPRYATSLHSHATPHHVALFPRHVTPRRIRVTMVFNITESIRCVRILFQSHSPWLFHLVALSHFFINESQTRDSLFFANRLFDPQLTFPI